MGSVIHKDIWDKTEQFLYYKDFVNPFVSVTSEVICDNARELSKTKKESFFLYYLYAILSAANAVEGLKYRIENNTIVYHDKLRVLTPIQVNDQGQFATISLGYFSDFRTFYRQSKLIIDNVSTESDPYGLESDLNQFDMILVSAVPNLYITSSVCTQKHKNGNDYPLLNVGKYVWKDGHYRLPIILAVHRGFADFGDITLFYKKIETILTNKENILN